MNESLLKGKPAAMSFEIEDHGEFLLVRLLAQVNSADLAAIAAEVMALEAAMPVPPNRVVDMTSVEALDLNFASMLKVVEKVRVRPLANPVKSAVIARRPLEIGFARMFQSLNDHPQIEIRILESLEAAERWFAGE